MIREAIVKSKSRGFSGGPILTSRSKVKIRLEEFGTEVPLKAYVMSSLPYCDLIIGTDMLPRITKLDESGQMKLETIFGTIPFH
ncbi:hypothetical protein BLOT_016309 [Blomia tropicalis]|nr:hypothetical protein BLOT_016309 [Blomia tropicalis]